MSSPMKGRRVGCVLAIVIALTALGAPATHPPGESRAASVSRSSVVPLAAIDLNGLFGDENEPDENEGGGDHATQSSGTPSQSCSCSWPSRRSPAVT
jgi:hypothetical protein